MNATADIFILKDGRRLGPYRPDEALLLVDEGQLSYEDICLRSGESATIRLHEALDWDEPPAQAADVFYPNPMPLIQAAPSKEEEKKKLDRLIYQGYPSVMNYPISVGVSVVTIIVGFFLWDYSGFILFSGLLLALLTWLRISFERTIRVYLVTPERVETVYGFVTKSSSEVRVRDIRAINVRTVGLKGWLGVGDLEFASAGGSDVEVVFKGVWKPHRLKLIIRKVQDAAA
ncbi:MAG: hypothetical protein ACI8UO_002902 [Verrucomicrobiales bacterium]